MAVDDLKTEWHLAPAGWIAGTTTYFNTAQGEVVAPPEDRVLTIVHRIYQRSEWSREEQSVYEVWRSASATDSDIEALKKRFPAPFRS